MKRFEFRLERVLGIRRFELDRARIALAAAEVEASRLAAVRDEAERRFVEGRRLLEEEMVVGSDGRRVALLAQAVRAGRTKWLIARQNVEMFEPKRTRARELVRRCRARVESLEKLRERRADLHRKTALASEQAELEGLAMARFGRSSLILWLACALLFAPLAARAEGGPDHASASEAAPASATAASHAAAPAPAAPSESAKGAHDSAGHDEPAHASTRTADASPRSSGAGFSKGVDLILSEVKGREVALAQRELEVAEREGAVKELEAMVAQRAGELERIRAEVEKRITSWAAQGQDRIEQLAGVYAVMPPNEAADLLSRLDLDLSVSIIRQMKKKVSANVLAAMKSDRALLISRRILNPLDPTSDAPPARPY